MKALVTGATGLLGSHACQAFLAGGHEVRALVRTSGPDIDGVEQVRGSLGDPDSLRAAADGVEVVVHCAAIYSYDRDDELERVNVEGTRAVVEAAAEAGVRRVVVTSSSVTCGSSGGPVARDESGTLEAGAPAYFRSKARQEEAALEAGARRGVEVVLACPTVILGGPATRLVPSNAIVARYLLDPSRSTYPGGCNVVSAGDVATGLALLAERGVAGRRYLLGGENISWRTLHSTVGDLTGVGGPYLEMPTVAAYLATLAAEGWARLAGTESLSSRDEALTIGRFYWYDHRRAADLGYRPGSARAALAESVAWLVAGPHLPRWVREGLRLPPDVRRRRPLVPRPL